MESINALYKFGEIPIGNSRVRLTNAKDCVKSGLIKDGKHSLSVKAEQLKKEIFQNCQKNFCQKKYKKKILD